MDNVRYNISPCEAAEVRAFIDKIDTKLFVPNGTVRATDRSHYDRYSFLRDENRVAIVYDTSASIVSITGRQDHAKQLLDIFSPSQKSVKRSTVPAQGGGQAKDAPSNDAMTTSDDRMSRAKLFVSPDRLRRRTEYAPVHTVFASAKGDMIATDEIFPPQTIKKKPRDTERRNGDGVAQAQIMPRPQNDIVQVSRQPVKRPLPSYGEASRRDIPITTVQARPLTEHGKDNAEKSVGLSISIGNRGSDRPRRAVISFGSDDDGGDRKTGLKINTIAHVQPVADGASQQQQPKRKRGRPPKQKIADNATEYKQQSNQNDRQPSQQQQQQQSVAPKKRGRPPKNKNSAVENNNINNNANNNGGNAAAQASAPYEYKNGYSVKNFPSTALDGAVKRLKAYCSVAFDGTEFENTPQEVKIYTVSDKAGQKVWLRYATKRRTLQLQGKQTDLFGEVMSQISRDTDYSSALESYVQSKSGGQDNKSGGKADKKVSDVQNKLIKRLPTAFGYLSEQSRIDFSYGIHDFGQSGLHLSDYSVLLVPAFRGLERFVFDLQRSEGINVKMIGQAYDKDDSGKYVLKSGYCARIGSVIYAEVMVALYTEYFSQRNFFAHSDNTDNNVSRSIPERAAAQRIFDRLLDVVEYNAKKLKEIGYTIKPQP